MMEKVGLAIAQLQIALKEAGLGPAKSIEFGSEADRDKIQSGLYHSNLFDTRGKYGSPAACGVELKGYDD